MLKNGIAFTLSKSKRNIEWRDSHMYALNDLNKINTNSYIMNTHF